MEEYVNISLDKYERLKMFENDKYEKDAKEFLKSLLTSQRYLEIKMKSITRRMSTRKN